MKRAWIAMMAVMLLTAGCEIPLLGGRPDEPDAKPMGQPSEMVADALRMRAQLRTMHASAAMQVVDKPADFGLSVNTEIYAGLTPDRLRIRATKASVDAFDALMGNGRVAFYVPRRKVLYQGALEDLREAKIAFDPRDVLSNLLEPDLHLMRRRWGVKYAHMNFQEIGDAVVLQELGPKPHWIIYLDPKTHLLLAVEELDDAGQITFVKIYDRYRSIVPPAPPGGPQPEVRWYPYRVRLQWPLEERSVEVNFKNVEPNIRFPESWAILDLPEGVDVKPIQSVKVEGDRIEEMERNATPLDTPPPSYESGDDAVFHGVAE